MILAAGNGQKFIVPESIQTMYKGDLEMIRLSTHLNMPPGAHNDVDKRKRVGAGTSHATD